MFIRTHTVGIAALTLCGVVGLASAQGVRGGEGPVTGVDLLSIDTSVPGGDAIEIVNTSPPSSDSLTGNIPQIGECVELEYGQDGYLYALDGDDSTKLHRLTASGAFVKTFTIEYPAGYDIATAAEWIDGELAVALATDGGGGAVGYAHLSFNDDTDTAFVSDGPHELSQFVNQFEGLAYDARFGNYYAVNADSGRAGFFVFGSGGPLIFLGFIQECGADAPEMSGLEFGSDGQLYAIPMPGSARAGELFIVNRFNSTCLMLGDVGNPAITGLTSRAGCSSADLAAPFGQLDFSDVISFLNAFGAGCP